MPIVSESPAVDIVVLNYNGAAHLAGCLQSMLESEYPNYRIVVVDNNSADGSWTLAERGEVVLIRNDRNLGWSGGNNVGIRYCLERDPKYVVLANNDIQVHPAWLNQAVAAAEEDPNLGVIGFEIFDAAEDASAETAFTAACRTWRPAAVTPVAHVGGMAMLIRARLFREIGLIDEAFWAYGEENDFLRRADLAGYSLGAVNVPVWHFGGASFGRASLRAALLQTEHNIQLLLKHERLRDLVTAAIRHVWRRCLPHRRKPSSVVERRLGGRPVIVNTGLLLVASARIIFKLPRIMRARRVDRSRAAAVGGHRAATNRPPPG